MKPTSTVFALLAAAGLLASGCSNTGLTPAKLRGRISATTTPTYRIATVTKRFSDPTSGGSGQAAVTSYIDVFFESSGAGGGTPISQVCQASANAAVPSGAKPCACVFSASNAQGQRVTGTTYATRVLEYVMRCPVHFEFDGQLVPESANISLSILPRKPENPSDFRVEPTTFQRGAPSPPGTELFDTEGVPFDYVHRYACIEQFKRGTKIGSQRLPVPIATGAPLDLAVSSHYCFQRADGLVDKLNGYECGLSSGNTEFSGFGFARTLFVRHNRLSSASVGQSQGDQGFFCPTVNSVLEAPLMQTNRLWPLDRQFILAQQRSSTRYPVGVEGPVRVSTGTELDDIPRICGEDTTTGGTPAPKGSLVSGCLGFAAQPDDHGACPDIRLGDAAATPVTVKTRRLRRYNAVYPQIYGADGKPVPARKAAVDQVYVLDRAGAAGGAVLGPKPCPFSIWNSAQEQAKTTATEADGYYSTFDPLWNLKNPDQIAFPSRDKWVGQGNPGNSCALILPEAISYGAGSNFYYPTLSSAMTGPQAGANPMEHAVHVRPMGRWIVHYEEDKTFEACAAPTGDRGNAWYEPPVHEVRVDLGGGRFEARYCSEALPNVNTLEPAKGDHRHAGAIARESAGDGASNGWTHFPIQMKDTELTDALEADRSYACSITETATSPDPGMGLIRRRSPAGGTCCANAGVPDPNRGAHLEPDPGTGRACAPPQI